MRLHEERWISGGGTGAEWRGVQRRRLDEARRGLREAEGLFVRSAPAEARRRRYLPALRFLLRARGRAADRMLSHPCLDYWLSLCRTHFTKKTAAADWHLHFGFLGGFAAALALETGGELSCDAGLDPDGRLFMPGSPWYLEFAGASRAPASLRVSRGLLRLAGEGFEAEFDPRDASPGGPLLRLEEVVPGVVVDDRGWLQTRGVTMHGRDPLEEKDRRRFAEVLREALRDMAERDPLLYAEMSDLLRVIVPLRNPENYGSVSSSYVDLRGLIALSPSDDRLLQAETLIHEFCHMKMNQLLAADAVLLPGQSGQVFYSPWRPDARRLRGLLLGAHAFLNVARYLSRSLQREAYPDAQRVEVMTNIARRSFQVETAMRALIENGSFTEFGRRFTLGMYREMGLLRHSMLWFPPALVAEQRAESEAHQAAHSLAGTVFHKTADFKDLVPRPRFAPAANPIPADGSAS
jgi:HEXXH motif-containing protein